MGKGLGSCSMDELQEIDSQLERSLKNIRARKVRPSILIGFHFPIFHTNPLTF